MPDQAPEVSVVVPVWGPYAGHPLTEALESLRAQDVPARIVVVDNAADPPVPPIEGAKVVRSEQRFTLGAARNLGLDCVETPYVVFWDADDLMLPGTLRRLRERLAADGAAVLAAASIVEGDGVTPHRWPRAWVRPLTRRRRLLALVQSVWAVIPTTGSALMRTSAVRDAGGFGDVNGGEDWQLGVSLAFRGRVLLERAPGRVYRRQVGSLWADSRSLRQLISHAADVRQRIRADSAAPRWLRRLLPVLAALQVGAALASAAVVRPSRAWGRRERHPRKRASR